MIRVLNIPGKHGYPHCKTLLVEGDGSQNLDERHGLCNDPDQISGTRQGHILPEEKERASPGWVRILPTTTWLTSHPLSKIISTLLSAIRWSLEKKF